MLKNMLTPKWQNEDPEIRVQGVAALDPSSLKDRDILIELLASDADERVPEACLAHFKTLGDLLEFRDAIGKPGSREEDLIADYITRQFIQANKLTAESIAKLDQNILARAYIVSGNDTIPPLLDQDSITRVLNSSAGSASKQVLVDRIDDPRVLGELRNAVNDKSLKNQIKERLDSIKLAEAQASEAKSAIEKAMAKIKRLAAAHPDNLYPAEVQVCIDEWNKHQEYASEEERSSFSGYEKTCRQKASEYRAQQEASNAAAQQLEDFVDAVRSALATLESAVSTDYLENTLPALLQKLEGDYINLEKNELKLPDEALPELRLLQSALACHQKISQAFTQLSSVETGELPSRLPDLSWPGHFASHPWLGEINEKLSDAKQKIKQEKALVKEQEQKISKNFRFLQAEIRKKNIRASDQITRKLTSLIGKLPENRQAPLQSKLDKILGELKELKDWNEFASGPAREKLCEKMESLAEMNMAPMTKFQKIQALQKEWKQLYAENPEDDIGKRFKQAGDRAFEPCKEYFQERDNLQAANLEKRSELCSSLAEFLESHDWDNPDWKQADKVYNRALADWQKYSPVNRDDAKPVQKRYKKLIGRLKNLLAGEKSANVKIREQLVEEARSLLELEDNKQAIEQIKSLQNKWNDVGIVFHKENQALWNDFRKTCDAIFDHRDRIKDDRNREIDSLLSECMQLVQDIKQFASASDDQLEANKSLVSEKEKEIKNKLASMPKGAARKVEKPLKDAVAMFRKAVGGIKARKKLAQLNDLRQQAAFVTLAEEKIMNGEALGTDIEQELKKLEQVEVLLPRIQALAEPCPDEKIKENTGNLQLLAIQMEIACDLPTPDEYSAQRMDYQLKLLTEKKSRKAPTREDIQALENQWLQTGFVSPTERVLLEKRKQLILEKAGLA